MILQILKIVNGDHRNVKKPIPFEVITTCYTCVSRYCGDSLRGLTLTSEGNLAVLTFVSNSRFSNRGFRATVVEIPPVHVSTTPSFRDVVRGVLRDANGLPAEEGPRWRLTAIYETARNMALSRVL